MRGVKIAFIGMTLKDTPNIVTASGVKGLTFTDEVQTANKLVPVLKKKGVNAIVVLIHQGGMPTDPVQDSTCGNGGRLDPTSAPVIDIAKRLDPAIDMIVSRDVPKDPAETALITRYQGFVKPIASRVIGHINQDVLRDGDGHNTLQQVTLNGVPLDDDASYRVVTNNFLQGGGDGFPTFTEGTDVYDGGLDIDASASYLSGISGDYTPGPLTRITEN